MDKRILVIEDDVIIRLDIVTVLQALGYGVFKAGNGQSGIAIATKELPHCVISDFNLPDMTGTQIIQHLKKCESLKHTKFVLCSGSLLEADILSIVDAHLAKPFNPRELTRVITKLLPVSSDTVSTRA